LENLSIKIWLRKFQIQKISSILTLEKIRLILSKSIALYGSINKNTIKGLVQNKSKNNKLFVLTYILERNISTVAFRVEVFRWKHL
jgi:hypothetical protein